MDSGLLIDVITGAYLCLALVHEFVVFENEVPTAPRFEALLPRLNRYPLVSISLRNRN